MQSVHYLSSCAISLHVDGCNANASAHPPSAQWSGVCTRLTQNTTNMTKAHTHTQTNEPTGANSSFLVRLRVPPPPLSPVFAFSPSSSSKCLVSISARSVRHALAYARTRPEDPDDDDVVDGGNHRPDQTNTGSDKARARALSFSLNGRVSRIPIGFYAVGPPFPMPRHLCAFFLHFFFSFGVRVRALMLH